MPADTPAGGAAQATGQPQTISCTDTPGAKDNILTPADVQVVDGLITAMNAHIQSVAAANGWAYLDLSTLWAQWVSRRGAFGIVLTRRGIGKLSVTAWGWALPGGASFPIPYTRRPVGPALPFSLE